MQKCLYLLCPTDCLESIINSCFRNENYFYTSLGNSVIFNNHTVQQIKKLIKTHGIREIYFVLSNNNNVISDALGKQKNLNIRGLNNLYKKIIKQKEHTEVLWQTNYDQQTIVSYYLNNKIKELKSELGNEVNYPIKISGKIYDKFENSFKNIYSDLICIEKHYLN